MLEITYVGHATLLIDINGVRLLTDPLLRNWVWHLRRQITPVDETLYQNIDAVLISHMHWDHLDIASLKLLGQGVRLIVPRGVGALLHRQGFQNIEEIPIGRATEVGPATIKATYARHGGARFHFGPAADCLGFIIKEAYTIYFPGDTDLFPEMANLAEGLDVALLPVWGWGPTLGTGHLDPYRAALALQLLRPRLAIPIHWGTFFPFTLKWVLPRLLTDPPQAFAVFAKKFAPEVGVQVVPPGASIQLGEFLE